MKKNILLLLIFLVSGHNYVFAQSSHIDIESKRILDDYFRASNSRKHMGENMTNKYYLYKITFHDKESKIDTAYTHYITCNNNQIETMILNLNGLEMKSFSIIKGDKGFKTTFLNNKFAQIKDIPLEDIKAKQSDISLTDPCDDFWIVGRSAKYLGQKKYEDKLYDVIEFSKPIFEKKGDSTATFIEKELNYFNLKTHLIDYSTSIDYNGDTFETINKIQKQLNNIYYVALQEIIKNGHKYVTVEIPIIKFNINCPKEEVFTQEYFKNSNNDFSPTFGTEK